MKNRTHPVLKVLLFFVLMGAIFYAGMAAMQTMRANQSLQVTEEAAVRSAGLITPAPKALSGKFSDGQVRLLADPPASATEYSDPPRLVLAHVESTDPDSPSISWKDFAAHLSKITGRPIDEVVFDNSPEQLKTIPDGKITLVALHSADTPFLVNNYGFQPIAVMGDDSGANGNHLDIIVPAKSAITKLADLKGHSLACTVPGSISGYRAAVAVLMRDQQLRPNVDYSIVWSLTQTRSIAGVASGDYDAAGVSDDKLRALVAKGKVDQSQFKTIYESPVIPRTTIGYFYNLDPKLAKKIHDAVLSFQPPADPPTAKQASAGESDSDSAVDQSQLHFIPIEYKRDFALVRLMDDSFDPRFDSRTKPRATTAPAGADPNQ